jgi:hypothetical protein
MSAAIGSIAFCGRPGGMQMQIRVTIDRPAHGSPRSLQMRVSSSQHRATAEAVKSLIARERHARRRQ